MNWANVRAIHILIQHLIQINELLLSRDEKSVFLPQIEPFLASNRPNPVIIVSSTK